MINIKINNNHLEVEEKTTILEASKMINEKIPTLCYLKKINNNSSCRICVVEVKGNSNLVPSCSTEVYENMEIFTNTEKVRNAVKSNLELIASKHNNCEECHKDNNCKLQNLLNDYNVETSSNDLESKIDDSSLSIVRDNNKCILCNRCVSVCKEIQSIAVIGKNKRGYNTTIGFAFDVDIKNSTCISCGQCILVCPTGALREKSEIEKVETALNNNELHTVVMTAPSVRFALGEEFGIELGVNVKGKMVSGLKALKFQKVFDMNIGADFTIMEEVAELIKRIKSPKKLPMFTSCCPSWVKYVEMYYPEMIKNLSTCKSPQQMLGSIIKTYYAKINNIDPKNIFVVSVVPCVAKKFEKENETNLLYPDIDSVITTRELSKLMKKNNININLLEDSEYDNPLGSGASVMFGSGGGVMETALRTFIEIKTKKPLEKLEFNELRGFAGIKEATLKVKNKEIKVAVVSGIKNAKIILEKIKNKEVDYHFVEFMSCSNGCVNGGGQPLVDFDKYDWDEVKSLRTKSLIEEDRNLEIRKAHENPDIKKIYSSYLIKPGSKKSKEILHRKYK